MDLKEIVQLSSIQFNTIQITNSKIFNSCLIMFNEYTLDSQKCY